MIITIKIDTDNEAFRKSLSDQIDWVLSQVSGKIRSMRSELVGTSITVNEKKLLDSNGNSTGTVKIEV